MKKIFKRIICVVIDSVGIGHAKDANKYNDFGANTLKSLDTNLGLNVPCLEKLGLGSLENFKSIKKVKPQAIVTTMQETATGKDSVTGHWELMGAKLTKPFNDFTPNGFPSDLIAEFERLTKRKTLWCKEASGTKIIEQFGKQHLESGSFIVYTSVDSTFQIAAHEDVISLDELYNACEIARKLTNDDKYEQWKVSRVIARPFIGTPGNFIRTSNRHDYSLDPFKPTALNILKDNGFDVHAIGKINDLFNNSGISSYEYSQNNNEGMDKTIAAVKSNQYDFIFTNLVDFDSMYGHPRNPQGYKKALEEFDLKLEKLLTVLNEDDLLFVVADHGNDPYYKGNDHTRENVPLIIFNKNVMGQQIKMREQFSDLGQTILNNFNLSMDEGSSFLNLIEIK